MKKLYTLFFIAVVSSTFAFGQIEGTWQMSQQAQALAVGPTQGDFSWWSNSAGDVTTRACFFDDRFVFEADGTFKNEMDGESWIEAWQGTDPDTCATPVAPHDGSNASTWAYDSAASTLTLTGLGAHLALPKVINGGEISDPANAASSIAYPVAFNATMDTMTIDIDYGAGFWHFVLAKNASTDAIEKLAQDIYSVYPNPTSSEFKVQTTEQIDGITLRDLTGRTIMTKVNPAMSETINVSNLPKGLYLLELRSGNQVGTEKIVVN